MSQTNNDILLQNYINAVVRLNTLDVSITLQNTLQGSEEWSDTQQLLLARDEQEYCSLIQYCNQLVAHFAEQGLDINQLAEQQGDKPQ